MDVKADVTGCEMVNMKSNWVAGDKVVVMVCVKSTVYASPADVVIRYCIPVLFQLLLVSFAQICHSTLMLTVVLRVLVTLLQSGFAVKAVQVSFVNVPVLFVPKM